MTRLADQNRLTSLEKPRGLHLCSELLSAENDCMTPTFKLKRHQATKHFKAEIDAMYVTIGKAEAARDAANRR